MLRKVIGIAYFLALSCLVLAIPAQAMAEPETHPAGDWMCPCPGGHKPLGSATSCNEVCYGRYGSAPAQADPHVLQVNRWRLLLQNPVIDSNTYAGLPIDTDAQFAAALTRIYSELYRNTAIWNAQATLYDAQAAAELNTHEQFYAPRFSEISAADDLHPTVRDENQEAKREKAALQAELDRLNAVRERFVWKEMAVARSDRLRNEITIPTRRLIDYFFGGYKKKDVETTVGSGGSWGPSPNKVSCCEEPNYAMLYSVFWNQAPLTLVDTNVREAPEVAKRTPSPTLYGDVETRLQVVEKQARDAETARKSLEWSRNHYQHDVHDWYTVSDKKFWDEIVAKNLDVRKKTYRLTEKEIPELEIEVKWAKDVLKSDAGAFYFSGGLAAAWTFFRKYAVESEIKRIAIEINYPGKYALTDAEVEHAWKLDKHAVFGAYKNYKKGKDIYALIKQAKDLEWYAEGSALAVADVMGRANLEDYQDVGDKLFGGLDDAARQEVRTALDQVELPFALKKFWEAYFTGVKPSFESP